MPGEEALRLRTTVIEKGLGLRRKLRPISDKTTPGPSSFRLLVAAVLEVR